MFEDIVREKIVIEKESCETCPQCLSTEVNLDVETGLEIYICQRCDHRWLR